MKSLEGRIFSRENPLLKNFAPTFDLSEKKSHIEVVFIMMQI